MYQDYQGRAEFLFVYITEAHPSDEWQLDSNEDDEVVFTQPVAFSERYEVAEACSESLMLSMPCVVDDMDNSVDEAYAGWPERLYVVDVDGTIAFAGRRGPFGFEPDEVRAWLERNVPRE
jgi:hypothetical protein